MGDNVNPAIKATIETFKRVDISEILLQLRFGCFESTCDLSARKPDSSLE